MQEYTNHSDTTFALRNISFRVPGRTLLHPLSLTFPAGKVTGLIGHNGSGKSTLLKMLGRHQPPSEGEILLDAQPLESWSSKAFARKGAYLPQQLPPAEGMTVRELVAIGRYPWHGALGRFGAADREKVEEAISLVGLKPLAHRLVDSLSGGERQRAWIAMLVAQDSRLREELVMNLIQAEENTPALTEWAQRLGIDLNQPRVVAIVEVDSGQLGVDSAMAELQQLQNALTTPERNNLVAIVSLTEMVVLKPALNSFGRWDAEDNRKRVEQLITRMKEYGQLRFRVSLGNYFTGPGSIARSYRTAKTTMVVGKQRMPESRCYFYQDLMLPVLLDSLRGDWQANELARPLARLKAMDNNGLLRRTLAAWFRHNVQPLATSKALFIHRNTLEYRLNRISELTGLDLGNFDDRLLLYVALQLDEER